MRHLMGPVLIIIMVLAGCIAPPPVLVSLLSPDDGSTTTSLMPVLSWSGGTADITYRLMIATDSNFQELVVDASNLSIVSYTVPSGKLNDNTLYYWRVQSYRGNRLSDWTLARSFRTPGVAPVSTVSIRVAATLDGSPWNGEVNFRISGPHTDSENTVPWSFNSIPAGSYTVTYNYGGPRGAVLTEISPSPTQQIEAGGMGYFTFNFHSSKGSQIKVSAILNGVEWTGKINYSIYGPLKDIETFVPKTFMNVPPGQYTLTYNSGGPQGAVFNGVLPAVSQSLSEEGVIEYKLNFSTGQSSTLTVDALNDGVAWVGEASYSISGPVSGTYTRLPLVLNDVPSGTYTISYQSGGPFGSALGNITPDTTVLISGGRPAEFTLNFYTQQQKSNVVINATLNGSPWTGTLNYSMSGPVQSTDYLVPRTYKSVPAGYYSVSYLGGGPGSAIFSSITPAPTQSAAAGRTVIFTLNFISHSSTGNIIVNATVDGKSWQTIPGSGPISYSIVKTGLADNHDVIPATFNDYPSGYYTLVYNSGGPIGATLTGISPAPGQHLNGGGVITFTMNFTSQSRGHITVDATLNGSPWSGEARYVVNGPYVESGDSVSMTFSNAPGGTYSVDFRGGGPQLAVFSGASPSRQELTPGGSIAFTLVFTSFRPAPEPVPGPVPHPVPGPMPGPVPNPTPEPMPGPLLDTSDSEINKK